MSVKVRTAQGLLLYNLWQIHGGSVAVAKKCGVHQQAPINWYIRGQVPLANISAVAEALNLNSTQKWGLNYKGLSGILSKRPKWKEVVQSFPFSTKMKERILFYAPPDKVSSKPASVNL